MKFHHASHFSKTTSAAFTSKLPMRNSRVLFQPPYLCDLIQSLRVGSLVVSRCLSTANEFAPRRTKKITIPRTLRLIDDSGSNLGVMSSDVALKLAESKNLKLVEVKRPSPNVEAVYRLFTSKQKWEEEKKKKKKAKGDPINLTKDITFFSQIGEHDLAVKISRLRGFLEKGHSAKVIVLTKYRRGLDETEATECREGMVRKIASELEGVGEKVSEDPNQRRRGIVCKFRPFKQQ